MAKTLKQLMADEKRKKAKVQKLEGEIKKEKLALSAIQKLIPVQKKKELDSKKKKPARKKK